MSAPVVLVAGLWMPSVAMGFLGAKLGDAGHATQRFAYPGRGAFEANVEALARFAGTLAAGPAHFVGHSLGGVLVLETLRRHREIAVASAAILGAPVRGCLSGRRFGRAGIGRWMMGASRPLWDEHAAEWPRPEPLGVLAGTSPVGLGRVLGRLPGENDGVVCLSETLVEGATDVIRVPVGHSGMIFSHRVARLLVRFLAAGRFA